MVKSTLSLNVTLRLCRLRHSPQVEKVCQEEKGCVPEYFGFVTATQFKKIIILLIKLMPFLFLFRIPPNPFSKGQPPLSIECLLFLSIYFTSAT